MSLKRAISLTVNGKAYERLVEARMTLADFLRSELELTGTHLGCEHGVCGACTILKENPVPTETEVREAISGNICRCTGYLPIVQAVVQVVSTRLKDISKKGSRMA